MTAKTKRVQVSMFSQGEDLPLFSGTPVGAPAPSRVPEQAVPSQPSFATCKVCLDTGLVQVSPGVTRRCWCEAVHK